MQKKPKQHHITANTERNKRAKRNGNNRYSRIHGTAIRVAFDFDHPIHFCTACIVTIQNACTSCTFGGANSIPEYRVRFEAMNYYYYECHAIVRVVLCARFTLSSVRAYHWDIISIIASRVNILCARLGASSTPELRSECGACMCVRATSGNIRCGNDVCLAHSNWIDYARPCTRCTRHCHSSFIFIIIISLLLYYCFCCSYGSCVNVMPARSAIVN